MPIFDFKCRACGHLYEAIIRGAQEPCCPQCSSTDAEKQLSMFSVGAPVPNAAQKEQQAIERAGWVKVGKPFKR